MMMNLFHLFDPSTSLNHSLNWLSTLMVLMLSPYQFWAIPSRSSFIWMMFNSYLMKELFKVLYHSYMTFLFIITLFFYIFFVNFLSLFPYIFSTSSHLSFSLTLSLFIWLSTFFYFLFSFPLKFFTHLTPLSTPLSLIFMMNLIELISMMIRPVTLSIRLSANMIAGHLLLSLLSKFSLISTSFIFLLLSLSIQITLMLLEMSVSLIQAYVFSILSLLYIKEIQPYEQM